VVFFCLLVCISLCLRIHFSMSHLTSAQLMSSPTTINQSSPLLVDLIAREFLHPPSTLPYRLTKPVEKGQVNQAAEVDDLFKKKTNGFFIEAGAFNGEYLSNTLFLETERNWTGLLVEPNKDAYQGLLRKQRKAWSINCCLSIHKYPEMMKFDAADVFGGVVAEDVKQPKAILKMRNKIPSKIRKSYQLQCLPLFSILLALGNPQVDLMSLDVEGVELSVLKTLPWEKVNIKALLIEVVHSNHKAVTTLLQSKGYSLYKGLKTDILYVKNKK